ncbi:MAG TPA: hypothetical protein VFG75_02745, partial [Gaiella sp.]|nr:hypothetical protein [Gaiella sp.]
GDENDRTVGHAIGEATGRAPKEKRAKNDVSGEDVVVLASGNLGLVYLMDEPRRMTLEEIEQRHPRLVTTLASHPHVGWLLVRSAAHGALAIGPGGRHLLDDGEVEGDDPLAHFSPNAPKHLLRTDSFPHVADVMVGSFYDPDLDEGCAFEELISFHGGLGGPQTEPFILHPAGLTMPEEPLVGAASVNALLRQWRAELNGPGSGDNGDFRMEATQFRLATESATEGESVT